MSSVRNDSHPAKSVSAHLLAVIAQSPTAVEARHHEIRARVLILNLEVHETISMLDAENLRIMFKAAIEKRLCEIASVYDMGIV
ncbi:hypothetical protein [Pseudomonas antarctica]|uniref:hypothetical protein n=1 Tax=Pseudomonas antarctica TaxID=219572 RepID=UPI003F752359